MPSEGVQGDMREFGFGESAPGEVDGDRDTSEDYVDVAEQTAAAPEEEVVEEVVEEAVEVAEEGEESEEEEAPAADSEEDILKRVAEYYAQPQATEPQPQPGMTTEDVNKALDDRLLKLAEAAGPADPQVQAMQEADAAEVQAFQALYDAADEEDRPGMMVQFQLLREKKLEERLEGKMQAENAAREQRAQQGAALQQLKNNVDQGLRTAQERGGMNAAIVKEFVESGDYARLLSGQFGRSMLSQALSAAPGNMYSAAGVLMSVYAAGALVQDGYQNMSSQPPGEEGEQEVPQRSGAVSTTAISAKASPQTKKKKKSTPEELYSNAIAAAGSAKRSALPFLFDQEVG